MRPLSDRILAKVATIHAQRQYRSFMRAAAQAVETQDRVLRANIKRHDESEFGRNHRFDQINSYREFVDRVPIQSFEDIRPYVQKVMDGNTRAMFGRGEQVLMFAMTSGSTDKPKYVPVTKAFLKEYRRGWNAFGIKALLDHSDAFLRPILQVVSPMDERRTHFGIPCGSISGLLAANQKRIVRRYYVTSPSTAYVPDCESRYYTIMRFAVPRDVSWMVTASPATQLKLARVAETHAERLIRDIRDGTLTPPGEMPDAVRCALMPNVFPQPDLARRLDAMISERGALLPRDYWRLSFLANWTGGSMGLHLQDFAHYFGDIPVRDIGLLATEGRVSIPLRDGTPNGVLDVGGSFFEFVEAGANGDDAGAVKRCHELEVGREYRVIMTTAAGFYRYDIGDYVRVHGFEGRAPIVEFLHRGENVASITGEKLTEWQVTTAFDRCCRALSLPNRCFVLSPSWGDPPFYRMYVEQNESTDDGWVEAFDRELSTINLEYASKRGSARLGSVQVSTIPTGALEKLNENRRRVREAGNEQFKHRYLCAHPGEDAELAALVSDQPASDTLPTPS